MNKVTAKVVGTTITFYRLGEGPPVILVGGGATDRTATTPLDTAEEVAGMVTNAVVES